MWYVNKGLTFISTGGFRGRYSNKNDYDNGDNNNSYISITNITLYASDAMLCPL